MINLLKFNKQYYQQIQDGKKTQTLRTKNKRLTENEIVSNIPRNHQRNKNPNPRNRIQTIQIPWWRRCKKRRIQHPWRT